MARVIHIADKAGDPMREVYIGRMSPFGNPFRVGRDGNRTEVLAKFATYFQQRVAEDPKFWYAVQRLIGRTLVCHCKPMDCHGDVIAAYLERRYGDPVTT